jgi:hypothetical protein
VFRVIAVAATLYACGGSVASPLDGPADASTPPPSGCPSTHDLDTNAALGQSCTAPEGTTCFDPACDACTRSCPALRCAHGTWAQAVNTAICVSQPDASPDLDAAPPPDARVCADLSPTGFDQSCTKDADCMQATFGTFCSNEPWCMCGGATINVADKPRYDAALQDLRSHVTPGPGGCLCPFLGTPRCAVGQCTLCGGPANPPGHPECPDAG